MKRSAGVILVLVLLGLASCRGSCSGAQASTVQGRELFINACSRCHGADGTGGLPLWDGGPSPRNFRDHAFQASQTDEQLKATIKNGKGAMPPFGTMFDDAQLAALVAQLRTFDSQR